MYATTSRTARAPHSPHCPQAPPPPEPRQIQPQPQLSDKMQFHRCTVDTVRTVIIYSLHVFYWLLFLKPRVSKTHSTLLNPATTFDCIVTSICLLPTDFCLLTCSRRLTCARAKRAVLCQALYSCTGSKINHPSGSRVAPSDHLMD